MLSSHSSALLNVFLFPLEIKDSWENMTFLGHPVFLELWIIGKKSETTLISPSMWLSLLLEYTCFISSWDSGTKDLCNDLYQKTSSTTVSFVALFHPYFSFVFVILFLYCFFFSPQIFHSPSACCFCSCLRLNVPKSCALIICVISSNSLDCILCFWM